MALVEYLVHEAVAQRKGMGYRLKIPYKSIDREDKLNDGNLVIEVTVIYDGEFKEEPNEQSSPVYKPSKSRH